MIIIKSKTCDLWQVRFYWIRGSPERLGIDTADVNLNKIDFIKPWTYVKLSWNRFSIAIFTNLIILQDNFLDLRTKRNFYREDFLMLKLFLSTPILFFINRKIWSSFPKWPCSKNFLLSDSFLWFSIDFYKKKELLF